VTYRTYQIFLGRLDDQRRHATEARRLHDATLEALLQARRAEQALVQEKERLAVTLRSIGDGVITTDLDGTVILINEVAERLTGWTQDEAVGQPLTMVFQTFDPDTRARRDNSVAVLIGTDRPTPGRCTVLVARDLSEHPIEEIAAPLRDLSRRVIGMVLAFRDISDALRVQAEHAKASKIESLGLLAGGIAHDFNNILMRIMGSISMARVCGADTPAAQRALAEAEESCVRARHLTWHLLTFAKGGVPVKETVALPPALEQAVSLAHRGRNVTCHLSVATDLWAIEADQAQLVQAFRNVIVNAQEAMTGPGIVEIHCENTFEPVDRWENALRVRSGHYVRVSISDTGVGISREHLFRIFDPYFSTKQGSSGLGLATTYSVMKDHGGYVTVESAPGRGTTVRLNFIALPIRSQQDRPLLHGGGTKHRVLVMDDDPSNRELAVNMLEFLGCEVDTAECGSVAVDRFQRARQAGAPFDVVMLDLSVPGRMGGVGAIDQLWAIDPDVRAILVSGHTRDSAMTEFRKYGFKAALAKPYSVQELSMTIHYVLGAATCRVH
jgi:PAS domain S-box-containing protein